MSVKEFFSAIFAILFNPRKFWRELKSKTSAPEFSVLKDYAFPVIALVQLLKFPLVGQPRPAMFFAIANFLIDVAALYLMTGGVPYLLEGERSERSQADAVTLICYSMTPVWICELFYFTGSWSWLFAFLALGYLLVITRNGLLLLLDLDSAVSGPALRNIPLFLLGVNSAAFLLIRAVMRLFNF